MPLVALEEPSTGTAALDATSLRATPFDVISFDVISSVVPFRWVRVEFVELPPEVKRGREK